MRNATLALTILLVLAAGQLRAAAPRAPKPDVGPGRIAWFDITSSDLKRSKEFYGMLFGWQFNALDGSGLVFDIVAGGTAVGNLRAAEGKVSGYNGVVYVQVSDIRAACAKVKELGGTVVPGFPFDLPDGAGAVGLALDPAGHPFGLYSRTPMPAPPSPAK